MPTSQTETIYCPQCGTPAMNPNQQFCTKCGSALAVITNNSASTSNATSNGSFFGGTTSGNTGGAANPINDYIEQRMRESGAAVAQQMRRSVERQVRGAVQNQVQNNSRKMILYGAVGVSALIVGYVLLGFLIKLFLPVAVVVLLTFIAYTALRRKLKI